MTDIPLLDLDPEIVTLWNELNEAVQRVIRSGQFIMGPEVVAFEHAVSDYLGIEFAVGLNSGTDALVIGLKAMGVGAGDEVITTAFSFFATAEAISLLGATPIFADIDPVTFNIDPQSIKEKITDRTRVLLPVHLYGHAADMDSILRIARKHNLLVLEDTAQAFGGQYDGQKLGTIGHAGAYSFFPSKNLGAYGDGGLFVTHDEKLAEQARMLRTHGAKRKYENEIIGFNSRLDAIQAAILNVKLPHLETFNTGRRAAASRYNTLLSDVPGVVPPAEVGPARHVYHQYTVRILDGKRDSVQKTLKEAGISSMVYYPVPIHQLPIYKDISSELPVTESLTREVLSLPIWPQITVETQEKVVNTLKRAVTTKADNQAFD